MFIAPYGAEAYASTRGKELVRTDLCAEAIRLARIVRMLMAPYPPEAATGLLALVRLHDSRRKARVDEAGDLITLEDQDRTQWDHRQIAEALPLVVESMRRAPGPFALQAAIAAEHCRARQLPKKPTGVESFLFTIYLNGCNPHQLFR